MLAENADLHLSSSQIETMLCAVVQRHMSKLERVALAAKSAPGFDVDQAQSDDKPALWTCTLLDVQGPAQQYESKINYGDIVAGRPLSLVNCRGIAVAAWRQRRRSLLAHHPCCWPLR